GLVADLVIAPSGPVPALLAATPVAIGAAVGLGRLEPPGVQRARERRVLDLPEALDLLAGALGAGLPLRRAVREVAAVLPGPVGEDLGLVVSLIDVGAGDRRAWSALADRPGWDGIARDIARAADTGTGLHGALQRHAERARRNAQARRQESARTTGVRSVLPLMVCFLPAFLCIGIVPTVGSMVGRVLALE
ncbi:MAG: type II secretion system F family protein, partial [Propionibacteriaceae bacterium]|nr:type II secretion system F family protein [Propionibacteriaceae bacterium]